MLKNPIPAKRFKIVDNFSNQRKQATASTIVGPKNAINVVSSFPIVPFMKTVFLTILFVPLMSLSVVSQHSAEAIKVKHTNDFELSDEGKNKAWEGASWNLMTPSEKGEPRKTRFKILYSDKGVYVLFHNEDIVLKMLPRCFSGPTQLRPFILSMKFLH